MGWFKGKVQSELKVLIFINCPSKDNVFISTGVHPFSPQGHHSSNSILSLLHYQFVLFYCRLISKLAVSSLLKRDITNKKTSLNHLTRKL